MNAMERARALMESINRHVRERDPSARLFGQDSVYFAAIHEAIAEEIARLDARIDALVEGLKRSSIHLQAAWEPA